jgi:catechol 2,3-dioxygenase-like lactoylglutathione lyase family enzyme
MRAPKPIAQVAGVVYHPAASEDSMRTPQPVRTYGLTHVALAVRDPQRSLAFYRRVLGVVPVYESVDFVQAQTPGSRDVIVFERGPRQAGRRGGIAHIGFRLQRASDIVRARRAVVAAGATIHDTGEFVPGEPYLFFKDPDGYEVEIWYEIPTRVDPKPRTSRASGRRTRTS